MWLLMERLLFINFEICVIIVRILSVICLGFVLLCWNRGVLFRLNSLIISFLLVMWVIMCCCVILDKSVLFLWLISIFFNLCSWVILMVLCLVILLSFIMLFVFVLGSNVCEKIFCLLNILLLLLDIWFNGIVGVK